MPLDQAMGQMKDVFYARFMDDWVVFTKSKTALRKVIKRTHNVLQTIKFKLHPAKTYIGKISHGFNFLGYYMDDQKILPSQETIRRFHERASALYEESNQDNPRRYHNPDRDISLYQANEEAPCDEMFQEILTSLLENTLGDLKVLTRMRRYVDKWTCWLRLGLSTAPEFTSSVQIHLPSLFSCWNGGVATTAR